MCIHLYFNAIVVLLEDWVILSIRIRILVCSDVYCLLAKKKKPLCVGEGMRQTGMKKREKSGIKILVWQC